MSGPRIAAIEAIPLRIPFKDEAPSEFLPGRRFDAFHVLLAKVTTNDGLVGHGEAFVYLPIFARALQAALEDAIAPLALGRETGDIAALVHHVQLHLASFGGRRGLLLNALAALDIALWDLAGKRAGTPLHKLLGGALRTEVACTASLNHYGDPTAAAERARAALARGFGRVKLHERDLGVVRAVRAAIGPGVALMVDANSRWTLAAARKAMPALLECEPYWLEDPIWPPEDYAGLRALKDEFGVPLAAGGEAGSVFQFRDMIAAHAVAFAQPDVCMVGGVSEMRKVMALCAESGVTLAPHTPFVGPAMLASLHVIAASRNAAPYAHSFVEFEGSMYGADGLPKDGKLAVPQGAGLGHEPDRDFLRDYSASSG